jgi:hypothetical protein
VKTLEVKIKFSGSFKVCPNLFSFHINVKITEFCMLIYDTEFSPNKYQK